MVCVRYCTESKSFNSYVLYVFLTVFVCFFSRRFSYVLREKEGEVDGDSLEEFFGKWEDVV